MLPSKLQMSGEEVQDRMFKKIEDLLTAIPRDKAPDTHTELEALIKLLRRLHKDKKKWIIR